MIRNKLVRVIPGVMALTLALAGVGTALISPASAAVIGSSASKDCPTAPPGSPYTIGSVVPCSATFMNTGATNATVDQLTEQAPNPGGALQPITCATAANPSIGVGGTLTPNTPCVAVFNVTIPNDPALCNTLFRDRVEVDLEYPGTGPPPLTSGAFSTNTFAVVCPPHIAVHKTASPLSKVGDAVHYTVQVCNTGIVTVTKQSVVDTLEGDLTSAFPATLAPGACAITSYDRTVLAGDPNPVVNTATATYTVGALTDTEADTAHTDLFQPGVHVTKNCSPAQVQVGENELCHIVITNTSSGNSPNLVNGTITDTLNGNLLDGSNTAIVTSTCTPTLPTSGGCTINTTRTVLASDPTPLSNTVTVHYNPQGFPNNITDHATANVEIVSPHITLTLDATPLSKPTDVVTYTATICNNSPVTVNRVSVLSALLGDETSNFPAVLTAGQCVAVTIHRTVQAGDPNPLVAHLDADYSGITQQATATSQAATDLFFPSVAVTKNCSPNPVLVGQAELCVITITNTSTGTTPPDLVNGTINDTLTGNLLIPNTAVTSSTCTANLVTGASCQINTTRTVLATDPNPLVNTVTVHYNPSRFPNDITASATASVQVTQPVTHQCTLGFWKQSQHFTFWRGYVPTQTWVSVGFTAITLNAQGNKTPANSNPTLLAALNAGGGGINSLARHAVAALLNSSSLQNPTFSTAQVIKQVNDAIAAGPAAIQALADKFDAEQNADNCSGFLNS